MAPNSKRVTSSRPPSYFSTAYAQITSPDNRSMVTSVAVFAAGVAFFHSSFSEILIPA